MYGTNVYVSLIWKELFKKDLLSSLSIVGIHLLALKPTFN